MVNAKKKRIFFLIFRSSFFPHFNTCLQIKSNNYKSNMEKVGLGSHKYQPINNNGYDIDQHAAYDRYDGNPLGDDTFTRTWGMTAFHYCCMVACFPCIPSFARTVEQGTRLEHHDLQGRLTVLNPGFHVRTPFVESFGQTIQMRDSTVCFLFDYESY
jgi:hypothetical protein